MRSNVKKNILALVKLQPHLKVDYNKLITTYWFTFDNVRSISDIPSSTPAETIRRNFQKLVASGHIINARAPKPTKTREFKNEFAALA